MNDRELRARISAALQGIPQKEEDISPQVLLNVVSRMESSMQPVAPLPAFASTVTGLVIAVSGAATLGAAVLGMRGIQAMSTSTAATICTSLLVLLCIAAISNVQLGIPGGRNWIPAPKLLIAAVLWAIALFAACFNNYSVDNFASQGLRCLTAGLFQAIPIALLLWLLLRRHFAVDLKAAMIARGTLAGLGGLIMLELHCPRLQVPHLAVWHTAVLPVCALAGVVASSMYRMFRRGPSNPGS
jgi:hypothetical protein